MAIRLTFILLCLCLLLPGCGTVPAEDNHPSLTFPDDLNFSSHVYTTTHSGTYNSADEVLFPIFVTSYEQIKSITETKNAYSRLVLRYEDAAEPHSFLALCDKRYTEDFFENHNLLLFQHYEGTIPDKITVSSVTFDPSSKEYTINVIQEDYGYGAEVLWCGLIVCEIEVPQTEISSERSDAYIVNYDREDKGIY
ncbi:MAG: hypothetical protein IKU11_01145 [Clostridia bacterium]|nr:hypothetical protein [Clostridia bacterium]